MASFQDADINRLLDRTLFSIDTSQMLSGVIDFLTLSEANLIQLRSCAIRDAEIKGEDFKFESENEYFAGQYQTQLVDAAEYRFDVSLSQRVRYAGLVAFITSIEWCAKALEARLVSPISRKRGAENGHVHFFTELCQRCSFDTDDKIADLKNLVILRNCIVHTAGFVKEFKYADDIPAAVNALKGFGIWDENKLGLTIRIDVGAVESYAKAACNWVPALEKCCVENRVLK